MSKIIGTVSPKFLIILYIMSIVNNCRNVHELKTKHELMLQLRKRKRKGIRLSFQIGK